MGDDSERRSNILVSQREKNSIYTNLKDLDFDFSIGKISQDDYARIRGEFKSEAAEVLTQMDELDQWIESELKARQIICNACSQTLPQDAVFCPKCGEKI